MKQSPSLGQQFTPRDQLAKWMVRSRPKLHKYGYEVRAEVPPRRVPEHQLASCTAWSGPRLPGAWWSTPRVQSQGGLYILASVILTQQDAGTSCHIFLLFTMHYLICKVSRCAVCTGVSAGSQTRPLSSDSEGRDTGPLLPGHWAGPHRAPTRPGRLQGGPRARPRQGEAHH